MLYDNRCAPSRGQQSVGRVVAVPYNEAENWRPDVARFVSAARNHLKRKILKLEERMHALEDALAIAQSSESDKTHPLLQQPLTFVDDDLDFEEEDEDTDEEKPQAVSVEALVDSFGTLHIDQGKKTLRFYGPSGGAEVRLRLFDILTPDLNSSRVCLT